ncbi:molybdopterin-binding protein [Fastidiosibacter lacustris]|uniref:molybdopterin-binding protein n=1 Tax=Fastidiosibacter lacustris TaxID=2056695 RepID=UPI000E356D85|nr:molybdopterin-binding protein [Fastidiosibacter lacustris]
MKINSFIAHRGANQIAPENTMLAFKKAYDAGCKWIELDVQLSADDVLFIFHDNNAKKLTGIDADITTWQWHKIESLSVLSDTFYDIHVQGLNRIPMLKTYLDWMAEITDLHTNIEVKVRQSFDEVYEVRLVQALLKLLAEYPQLHDRILLSSFSEYVLGLLAGSKLGIAREFLLEIEDWQVAHRDVFDRIKQLYGLWNCVALGINNAVLTLERIVELKASFGKLLTYSNSKLTDEVVLQMLKEGIDGIFIDDLNLVEKTYNITKNIGFLATGDEITTGDVLNTNTPELAQRLYSEGFEVGIHLACFDNKDKLKTSLKFLLNEHAIVITVGGLGPTEDDKTVEAIAEVFEQQLVFNEASWQRIYERVAKRFGSVPENNKKQAYFPQGAQVLINEVGTADGCYIHQGDKHLFMLPGPPHECLPMFEKLVLPILSQLQNKQKPAHFNWQLIGVSEAHIACQLKPLADKYQVELGYRAAYPYLEVKLHLASTSEGTIQLVNEIDALIEPFVVSRNKQSASKLLKSYLRSGEVVLTMQKDVTKGYVYSHLAEMMPVCESQPRLSIQLQTNGMTIFWQKTDAPVDDLSLLVKVEDHVDKREFEQELHVRFSNKGKHSLNFVYEWICAQVVRLIQKEMK